MFDKKLSLKNSKNLLFGIFEDGNAALSTTQKVHTRGVDIIDCFSPYPIHGMEKAMGLTRSRLPIASFMFAMTGFTLALALQFFIMYIDWKLIIGNKPYMGIPSWIPVLFEFSILCTAFGTGILFFVRSSMVHGKISDEIVDIKQTDYRIVLAMSLDDKAVSKEELVQILKDGGAVEVKERTNIDAYQFEESVI